MGCGGSKATTVAIDPANSQQSEGGAATTEMAGSSPPTKTPSTERAPTPAGPTKQVRRPSRVAPLGASTEDLQAEELPEGEMKEQRVTEQSMAFIIPFEDEPSEESIIKKHPPKRLQRLEEIPASLPTLEEIAEKQAEAEMRRQKILQSRVQSSKNIRNGKSFDSENADDYALNINDSENNESSENNKKSEANENIENNDMEVPENHTDIKNIENKSVEHFQDKVDKSESTIKEENESAEVNQKEKAEKEGIDY